jgi:hypothetical protein
MKKINNSMNYHPKEGQVFTMPSCTIPDQTMSMRTILERHAKGLPTIGADPKQAYYDGGEYLPDPKTLDLSEREELTQQYKQELNEFAEKRKAEEAAQIQRKNKQTEDMVTDLEKRLEERAKERQKEKQ